MPRFRSSSPDNLSGRKRMLFNGQGELHSTPESNPYPCLPPYLVTKRIYTQLLSCGLFCSSNPHSRAKFKRGFSACTHARGSIRKPTKTASKQAGQVGQAHRWLLCSLQCSGQVQPSLPPLAMPMCGRRIHYNDDDKGLEKGDGCPFCGKKDGGTHMI